MNLGPEIYFSIIIGIFWILIINWFFRKNTKRNIVDITNTKVSILLAVRNEEENIVRCLTALSNLEFPLQNIEILIGNDASEDNSEVLIRQFIADKPQFKLINITETFGETKGKANVLAHLAKEAKGDYFFITDADIQVQPQWITAMLCHVGDNTGIVTGYTHVTGNSILANLQSIDWTLTQSLMKIFFDTEKPLTTMGNNMLVTKEAYINTGGYESIPFSITEDYALFAKVNSLNYECVQVVDSDVKVFANAMPTLEAVLIQRKRWTLGVYDKLPWYLSMLIVLQLMYFPMAIYIGYISLEYSATALAIKCFVQSFFLLLVFKSVKQKVNFVSLLLFDLYSFYIVSTTVLNILLISKKVLWKGREY